VKIVETIPRKNVRAVQAGLLMNALIVKQK